jgi:acyl-CoA thioesterase-1
MTSARGARDKRSQRLGCVSALAVAFVFVCRPAHAQIVAFGASNVSGWNVAATEAFPAQLRSMLRGKGYDVGVANAGVYGNTTTDMRNRMDKDIPPGTKIVILDITGGIFNDLNKGTSRQQGDADMAAIEARLQARGITVIPVSGQDLPAQYHQTDGIHLTPAGHEYLASQLVARVVQVLGPPQAAQAQAPSTDVRDACVADARRLCAAVLGDEAKRHECMHEHRAELSKDCLSAIARSRQQ